MLPAASTSRYATAAILLSLLVGGTSASTITTDPNAVPSSIAIQTCEFRTINYITDILPQQCLKSTWSHLNGTSSTQAGETSEATNSGGVMTSSVRSTTVSGQDGRNATTTEDVADQPGATSSTSFPVTPETPEASQTELESEDLNEESFLSFEEWRKQTLAKAGQENANIGGKKSKDGKRRDSESIQNHLDSLGDEGEIDLDFGAFKTGKIGNEAHTESGLQEEEARQYKENGVEERKKKDQYRSKDAGKTCKERFSYASFDAGATVLKTHSGAKNSKAILIENKDSYMLSECKTKNKFVIVELSEDIWIDTLVLANYEFFSSMIKSFRVSVSDRYPVKMEKWKDVGTYEARNSREIQAFLIENPQIWARYIRIEFLTHYGNEYYCPLSLVRVHGTRMLESWKESEANNDEEDEADGSDDSVPEERFIPEAVADTVAEEEKLQAELKEAQAAIQNLVKEAQEITATLTDHSINASQLGDANTSLENFIEEQMSTPWAPPDFDFGAWMNISQGLDVCLPKEITLQQNAITSTASTETITSITGPCAEPVSTSLTPVANSTTAMAKTSSVESPISSSSASTAAEQKTTTVSTHPSIKNAAQSSNSSTSAAAAAKLQNVTSSIKSKISSTSSAVSSLPTQQESFFKAVSRRLQLLEANSTLSLKYIEEQSRTLREAFSRVEKRQLSKTTTFLDTLNSTVLTELKEIRQQYDEIWQSTVISLESQREEAKKEILAISSRLNILADEVVFQKRMSIIQSVLLLLCLGLVIFSRVSPTSPLDFSNSSRYFNSYPVGSPIISPEYVLPDVEIQDAQQEWANRYHIEQSGDSSAALEYEGEEDEYDEQDYEDEGQEIPLSPPTPTSIYSHSSSIGAISPSKEDPSSANYFNRSLSLKRSVSAQHTSTYNNSTTNDGQNVRSSIPARIFAIDRKDLAVSRSRSRANSNPHQSPGKSTYDTSPSPVRTLRTRNSTNWQNGSPLIVRDPTTPTTPTKKEHDAISQPLFRALDISPPVFMQPNGQPPIINTTPASPPPPPPPSAQAQWNSSSSRGSTGRNRNISGAGFDIARKPLPTLPKD